MPRLVHIQVNTSTFRVPFRKRPSTRRRNAAVPRSNPKRHRICVNGNGVYMPLVTAGNVPPGTQFAESEAHESGTPGDVYVLAVTPDFSHMIFTSAFALTKNAPNLTATHGKNLFEWSASGLQLASVLPGGEAANGGILGADDSSIVHALSNDGSRVFWSPNTAESDPLYMRDTVTDKEVQVDAPAPGVSTPPADKARFQVASADGSEVFFTDEEPLTLDSKLTPVESNASSGKHDLYVCQIIEGAAGPKCDLTDLTVDQNTGETADVQPVVVGASEYGSAVYFVARGVLANGAEAGKDNLYVASEAGSRW